MAKDTTLAWASFPSREEAAKARRRLEENGFARNSINLDRRPDGSFTVEVHTREENLSHVEQLLNTSESMYAVRQFGANTLKAATSNPLVLLGGAALVGLVAYSLLPRNRRPTVYSIREIPGRMREGMRDLPDTVRETARTVRDTMRDLPGTVAHAGSNQPEPRQGQSR